LTPIVFDKSFPHRLTHHLPISRFEAQLQAVKERLEAAKVSSRNIATQPQAPGGLSFGARIAKPLRGGMGMTSSNTTTTTTDGQPQQLTNGAPSMPILSNLMSGDAGNKRSSWFFNNR